MAERLTREEEARLVAEAEAVYEAGGYDPAELRRVNVIAGPKMLGKIVEYSFTLEEARHISITANERGISFGQLLNEAIRSYVGLPERARPPLQTESGDVQDPEHDHA